MPWREGSARREREGQWRTVGGEEQTRHGASVAGVRPAGGITFISFEAFPILTVHNVVVFLLPELVIWSLCGGAGPPFSISAHTLFFWGAKNGPKVPPLLHPCFSFPF